jgi:hypothetical protein
MRQLQLGMSALVEFKAFVLLNSCKLMFLSYVLALLIT